MKKLRNLFNRLTKKTKIIASALLVTAAIGVPAAVLAGYGPNGPDRVIYDFSNPAQREGAFDAPRFNSYINTNVYGDERAFLDAKECVTPGDACYVQGVEGGYKDQVSVQPGKEYIVRAYIHNIANPSTNASGLGVAKNTKFRLEIPGAGGMSSGFTLNGRIMADNSIPKEVYDTVDLLNADQDVKLDFVGGSARIFNDAHPNGKALPDGIVGPNGTLIGYDEMNGIFPGCFDYSAFVTVRVKVSAPDLEIQKRVSKVDMPKLTESSEVVHANKGEAVNWRIDYKNNGSGVVSNVVIRDQLPQGVTLVPGSIVLTHAATPPGGQVLQDTSLGGGGVDVGDYFPNGNGVIRFKTTINQDIEDCELTNVAFGRANNVPELQDDAKVIIDDCNPVVPQFSCDALEVTRLGDQRYRYTVRYTATNGAEFKNARFNFGDDTEPMLTTDTTVEHGYEEAGRYTARVEVTFRVDGEDKTVTSDACASSVVIPEYSCDSLTARSLGNRRFSFTTAYTVREATFRNVRYNFGDGTDQVVSTNPTVDHTYAKDGDYTVRATVTFVVDGQEVMVSSGNCVTRVTAATPVDNCPIPGKTHLPVNSPECKENPVDNCPIPGKENLPKNSPECVIVNTGIGDLFGVVTATTIAGAAAHHVFSSRRFGRGL